MAMASALTSLALGGPVVGVLVSRHVDRHEQVMGQFDQLAERQDESRERIRRIERMADRSGQMLLEIRKQLEERRR